MASGVSWWRDAYRTRTRPRIDFNMGRLWTDEARNEQDVRTGQTTEELMSETLKPSEGNTPERMLNRSTNTLIGEHQQRRKPGLTRNLDIPRRTPPEPSQAEGRSLSSSNNDESSSEAETTDSQYEETDTKNLSSTDSSLHIPCVLSAHLRSHKGEDTEIGADRHYKEQPDTEDVGKLLVKPNAWSRNLIHLDPRTY